MTTFSHFKPIGWIELHRRIQVVVIISYSSNERGNASRVLDETLSANGLKLLFFIGLFWLREQDLNLRPSGYEPDELPGCSIPRPLERIA